MYDSLKEFIAITWKEFIDWVYANNDSIPLYVGKVLVAVFFYIVISDCLKKIFTKIQKKVEDKGGNHIVCSMGFGAILYIILASIILTLFNYLNKFEVSPTVTMVVLLFLFLLLVIKGVFTKLILKLVRNIRRIANGDDYDYYDDMTVIPLPKFLNQKSARFLIEIVSKLVVVTVATFFIYFSYQGIIYLLNSGGRDISYLFIQPENVISRELGTTFHEDETLVEQIPVYTNEKVTVKTDGDLNIVYINGQKVGFNTYSRKYAIYGISVNQQEIKVARKITFNYDESTQSLQSLYGNKSNIYFYHNTTNNDCVVVMVNETSNRVVSVSYFNDFDKVSETLMLSFD